MAELEHELRALADALDWPATPALSFRPVAAGRRRRARTLVAVLAVLAVAVTVALAVPASRSAILRVFDLDGVTVERVGSLPPAEERPLAAGLGPRVGRAQALTALQTPIRLPAAAASAPIHLRDGVVSVVFGAPAPVLLTELRTGPYLLKKLATLATSVEWVTVGRAAGLWIAGRGHVVALPGAPPRLAGNVLVWEYRGVVYRLEGPRLTRRAALRLATELGT